MVVMYMTWKGKPLDTMEKYYSYQEAYRGTQIDSKYTVLRNRIFNTLILYEHQ
jgi:hypothetical protein